jgi:hypothetical protein
VAENRYSPVRKVCINSSGSMRSIAAHYPTEKLALSVEVGDSKTQYVWAEGDAIMISRNLKIFAIGALSLGVANCGYIPGTASHEIAKAEQFVRSGLNDPDSASFRNEKYVPASAKIKASAVCGEVNAKNRMGGFVGFSRFIANGADKLVLMDPNQDVLNLQSRRMEAQNFCNQMDRYACPGATDAQQKIDEQQSFDSTWKNACG